MALDLTSLHSAIAQCEDAVAICESDLARTNARLALHLRAGAIQAFEFTYELCIKTLKRFLEASEANPAAVDEMTFNELIRRGFEVGVLRAELADWKAFRHDRATTSHTYDAAKAQAIFEAIPLFLAEAKFLLARTANRHAETP